MIDQPFSTIIVAPQAVDTWYRGVGVTGESGLQVNGGTRGKGSM